MAAQAQFEVKVGVEDCARFAQLSGDWNPLHTDAAYAARSAYKRQVLHGAFSAGLVSRMAGMHLPGESCLLHGMRLRFVAPILPPATLVARGRLVSGTDERGRVEVTISDASTGMLYVEASYEFGRHQQDSKPQTTQQPASAASSGEPLVLVTGASGGLGGALLRRLGKRARGVSRGDPEAGLRREDFGEGPIAAIVHCAWPQPDNRALVELEDPAAAIERHVASPLRDIQLAAALLAERGSANAPLVLVGSTFARPGRHYFRSPLYSVAKSTVPVLVEILALELARKTRRCLGVVFDVLDGGMNKSLGGAARVAHADRSPWGELATPEEAAEQIAWLLDNQGTLISGATITLSAGALP